MGFETYRERMLAGERMAGTFLKTPALEMIEILSGTGLDFVCLDAEHAAFDRARLDACLAMARALDFPTLVRIPSGAPENVLMALDAGALGIVCPHVSSAEIAADLARSARFGHGGRGFAGSTRWANYTRTPMAELLDKSRDETVVIAQIEEPEGVEAAHAIAATDGIDGLFIGPADLSIALGESSIGSPALYAAYDRVGQATKAAGKAFITFAPTPSAAEVYLQYGVTVFYIGSEQGFVASGADAVADGIKAL